MATVVLANLQGSQKRLAPTFDRRSRSTKECLPFHVDALLMSDFLVNHRVVCAARTQGFCPESSRMDAERRPRYEVV
jgi:hypothetical protein